MSKLSGIQILRLKIIFVSGLSGILSFICSGKAIEFCDGQNKSRLAV